MRPLVAAALASLATACITSPLAPDPSIDLSGRWTIIAVDGEPTGGDRRFNFQLNPTYGSAQFGCNAGSGSYKVSNGWFVAGDPWIITAAGCPNKEEREHFEDKGFHILTRPLAIERRSGGVRLRNGLGIIDLVPTPPLTIADIAGSWNVVSINGVGTPGGERFRITFTPAEFRAAFGCNDYRGSYLLENDRFSPTLARQTEMACELTGPNAPEVPVMQLEEWGFAILHSGPKVALRSERGMELVSPKGTISLVRVG